MFIFLLLALTLVFGFAIRIGFRDGNVPTLSDFLMGGVVFLVLYCIGYYVPTFLFSLI